MKLSDLKTGMIVTRRDGMELVVFIDSCSKYNIEECSSVIVNASTKSWNSLTSYNEDMKNRSCNIFDIMKVEIPHHPYSFMDINYERKNRKLLWEREEVKEVTMKEIEEKFGCKVKIVDRKE